MTDPKNPKRRWGWILVSVGAGIAFIVAGALVTLCQEYVGSVLGNVGAALVVVGAVLFLERRIVATVVADADVARTVRFAALTDGRNHAARVLKIFDSEDRPSRLYRTQSLNGRDNFTVPVFVNQDENWVRKLDLKDDDGPFDLVQPNRLDLGSDDVIIASRQAFGIRLWDGPLLYALGPPQADGRIPLGVCNYFAYVTTSGKVHAELAGKVKSTSTVMKLTSLEAALASDVSPLAIAGAATCVFDTPGGRMVATARRSQLVVSGRGLDAVSPSFGFEPNRIGRESSKYGLPVYNFLKEFLEEIFNQKHVDHAGDQPRLENPDWIFESDAARDLIQEFDEGRATLYCTGVILDPTDSSIDLLLLAHFESHDYYEKVRKRAFGNWEADYAEGVPRITFRPLDAIDESLSLASMTSVSIASLDRARVQLAEIDRLESEGS